MPLFRNPYKGDVKESSRVWHRSIDNPYKLLSVSPSFHLWPNEATVAWSFSWACATLAKHCSSCMEASRSRRSCRFRHVPKWIVFVLQLFAVNGFLICFYVCDIHVQGHTKSCRKCKHSKVQQNDDNQGKDRKSRSSCMLLHSAIKAEQRCSSFRISSCGKQIVDGHGHGAKPYKGYTHLPSQSVR